MAINQVNLNEKSVKTLKKVDAILEDKNMSTASDRVNESLALLATFIENLDRESFLQITGYEK